jgi:hypothetical protein
MGRMANTNWLSRIPNIQIFAVFLLGLSIPQLNIQLVIDEQIYPISVLGKKHQFSDKTVL